MNWTSPLWRMSRSPLFSVMSKSLHHVAVWLGSVAHSSTCELAFYWQICRKIFSFIPGKSSLDGSAWLQLFSREQGITAYDTAALEVLQNTSHQKIDSGPMWKWLWKTTVEYLSALANTRLLLRRGEQICFIRWDRVTDVSTWVRVLSAEDISCRNMWEMYGELDLGLGSRLG